MIKSNSSIIEKISVTTFIFIFLFFIIILIYITSFKQKIYINNFFKLDNYRFSQQNWMEWLYFSLGIFMDFYSCNLLVLFNTLFRNNEKLWAGMDGLYPY